MGTGVTAAGPARDLAPAAHAMIRRYLALIPAFMWLVWSGSDLVMHLPFGWPGAQVRSAGRDFVQYYLQGVLAHQGNTHVLYDPELWMQLLRRQVPGVPDSALLYPQVYGPQIAVLFSPFAHLTYDAALSVFLYVSLAIYLVCSYAVWRTCARLREWPALVALVLLACPAWHYTLRLTQISVIALVCFTGAFFALRANRAFVAGLAIGSLIYKPHLGLAAAVVFLCAREWRIVLGAVSGAAIQLAIGGVALGPSVLAAYAGSLLRLAPDYARRFPPFRFHMHSWNAFFELLAGPGRVATGAYIAASAITLILAVRCWRAKGPLALRYAVLLIATVLVNPHMFVYDLILLVPAFLLLWDWAIGESTRRVGDVFPALPFAWLRARSFGTAVEWLLYFCYMSPVFAIVAAAFRVQLSVPGLALLGGVLSVLLLSPSRRSGVEWSTA